MRTCVDQKWYQACYNGVLSIFVTMICRKCSCRRLGSGVSSPYMTHIKYLSGVDAWAVQGVCISGLEKNFICSSLVCSCHQNSSGPVRKITVLHLHGGRLGCVVEGITPETLNWSAETSSSTSLTSTLTKSKSGMTSALGSTSPAMLLMLLRLKSSQHGA